MGQRWKEGTSPTWLFAPLLGDVMVCSGKYIDVRVFLYLVQALLDLAFTAFDLDG